MKPSQVLIELDAAVNAGLPVFLHGPPGIGKSDLVKFYAASTNRDIKDIRASQLDPVDARGIPVPRPDEGVTTWYPPDFLPRHGRGVLFLDELNRANQDTQSALYQLILDGRIGDYILPAGWVIIAAGNNDADGCMVQPMSRALKNRFIHFEVEVNYDDWHQWALRSGIAEEVIAFLKFRSSALDEIQEAARDESGDHQDRLQYANAFATPRSWEFASKLLKSGKAQNRKVREMYSLIAGAIGDGMAGEFIAYCDIYADMPDLDELIARPESFVATTSPNKLFAIGTGLAARATRENFGAIKKITDKMSREYAAWIVDDCLTRNPDFAEHPAYIEWVYKNADFSM